MAKNLPDSVRDTGSIPGPEVPLEKEMGREEEQTGESGLVVG